MSDTLVHMRGQYPYPVDTTSACCGILDDGVILSPIEFEGTLDMNPDTVCPECLAKYLNFIADLSHDKFDIKIYGDDYRKEHETIRGVTDIQRVVIAQMLRRLKVGYKIIKVAK